MAKRIIQMGLISSHSTYDSDVLELSNAEFDSSGCYRNEGPALAS